MQDKINEAYRIFDDATTRWNPSATMILYSGGNDSTALLGLFHQRVRIAGHCDTTIGIKKTRLFVEAMAEKYGVQLVVESPGEENSYEAIVREYGFPGPGKHGTVYRRLKERALRKIKKHFPIPRLTKYLFVTGVRASESARRAGYKCVEKVEGNTVWVNPIYHWTDDDMIQYRKLANVPENPVSKILGISGECLCGCYAQPDELEKIRRYFPDTATEIDRLATIAKDRGLPCQWGKKPDGVENRVCGNNVGALCAGCGGE